jgi:SPP1 gp7 family putative phage head morphogenesis protein
MLDVVAHAFYRPHVARMTKRVGRQLRPIRPSRQAELWYLNRLTDGIADLKTAAKRHLLNVLRPLAVPSGVMDADPWAKALADLSRDKDFNSLSGQAQLLARLAAKKSLFWTDDKLAKEVSRSLGVDIRAVLHEQGKVADKMREFTKWNVDLIQSIPDRFKADLADKLSDAWASGLRVKGVESIVDDVVQAAGDNAEANAGRIARDQMGKMNAAFNQVRQTELSIRKYRWQTAHNEKVRPEHAAMETGGENGGGIYSWDEPGPLAGTIDGEPCYPGEDVECHCAAIPVFDLDALEQEAFG